MSDDFARVVLALQDEIDPMRPQYATTMDLMRRDMDAALALTTPEGK